MNKKVKTGLVLLLILILSLFGVYKYMLNAAKRNIETEKVAFSITTKAFSDAFANEETIANTKYLNKTIEVKGIVTDINDKQLIVDGIVICDMLENQNPEIKNKVTTIKGRFVGYDNLMGEFKLDQCTLTK